jgi:hypothetical protein
MKKIQTFFLCCICFLQILIIKTLDPDLDSIKLLDQDPDSMKLLDPDPD